MNIWSKMITAIKGSVNEAGEAIIDVQALRILDQEIREAADELNQSKESLVAIIAHQKVAEEKYSTLDKEKTTHEGYAVAALNKGDDALALEVAGKIADIEAQLADEKMSVEGYQKSADQLRSAIKQAEQNIKQIKQQVDMVRATENVQRAQATVAQRHNGSTTKLHTAMESLERIKEKQALKAAKFQAASDIATENSTVSLHDKLEKAGIKTNGQDAQDILTRLKTQQKKTG